MVEQEMQSSKAPSKKKKAPQILNNWIIYNQ